MTELAVPTELLNVATGEVLPATAENAATVILAARDAKDRLQDAIRAAEAWLEDESRRLGTKTLHTSEGDVTLTGGLSVEYNAQDLAEALAAAGCPEDRINACVLVEVSYKVDRRVLRQLMAANPDYAAAAELAAVEVVRPVRATIKRRP